MQSCIDLAGWTPMADRASPPRVVRRKRLSGRPHGQGDAVAFISERRGTPFDPQVVDAFRHYLDTRQALGF